MITDASYTISMGLLAAFSFACTLVAIREERESRKRIYRHLDALNKDIVHLFGQCNDLARNIEKKPIKNNVKYMNLSPESVDNVGDKWE